MTPVIDLVAGARPNFMKLAPVLKALRAHPDAARAKVRVVHTGQHYDAAMNDVFFEQLEIPAPDIQLGVGSGSHAVQTARVLERYEEHLLASRPALTVVFGDVNSTLSCALAAVKLHIPVAHVEAGLRSGDRTMPEEINRLMVDAIASYLFVTEPSGLAHLEREGVPDERVFHVGNVMIDTLLSQLPKARATRSYETFGVTPREYGVVTLHRPSNVDEPERLLEVVEFLEDTAGKIPLVFPLHPRTRGALERSGLTGRLEGLGDRLRCVGPMPYLELLALVDSAKLVITDSGGIQEETTALQVPCLTMRANTERPVTLDIGTSRLVGHDLGLARQGVADALSGAWETGRTVPLWDGHAGERIAEIVLDRVGA